MKRPFTRPAISPSTAELRAWFNSATGRQLLLQEQAALDHLLDECFGYYLLQIGNLELPREPLRTGRIKSRISLVTRGEYASRRESIVADPLSLPVASDSIDAVLLTHTLEFSQNPHQLLREIERVLIPEGHVLIVGFNPWSLWGLWQLFRLRSKKVPWCGHFISAWRMHDWLSLLGFQVKSEQPLMFRPPLQHPGLMQRLQFLERLGARLWPPLSGVYMMLAVKRVSRLTPIKPVWKLAARSLRGSVAESTTHRVRHFRSRE